MDSWDVHFELETISIFEAPVAEHREFHPAKTIGARGILTTAFDRSSQTNGHVFLDFSWKCFRNDHGELKHENLPFSKSS